MIASIMSLVSKFQSAWMWQLCAYRRGDGGRRDVEACCSKIGVSDYVSEGGAGAWAICYGEARRMEEEVALAAEEAAAATENNRSTKQSLNETARNELFAKGADP